MPRLKLTQHFADNPPVVKDRQKTDYFDTRLPGSWKPGWGCLWKKRCP
jgi:hypothetical protein